MDTHNQLVEQQPTAQISGDASTDERTTVTTDVDLIGGPYAVIESDPGVFTSLTRKLGIKGLEVVEIYDIAPWAVDHLNPRGLFFCFLWHKDNHRPSEFKDPAAERVWFANQVIDDACASQAILNVALNCPDINIGEDLEGFRAETKEMSPVMKGLAISNSSLIRKAHNSLARPADLRGARNALATSALEAMKPPKPKATPSKSTKSRKPVTKTEPQKVNAEESYHFIGYVPAHGKVWELDGLKSGPLEVGELNNTMSTQGWMNIVRPVINMKMRKYGGGADGGDIRFNLLALVDDHYLAASDELELLKREKKALERRLDETYPNGWKDQIEPTLLVAASESFSTKVQSDTLGKITHGVGLRKQDKDIAIVEMPQRNLIGAWEACVRAAMPAKIAVEDEIAKSVREHTDHIKRTHDYEPFLREYFTCLHNEGLLNPMLGRDEDGKKIPANRKAKGKGKF